MYNIALPVAAGIAVVGSAMAGRTSVAFWAAAGLFAASVALLCSSDALIEYWNQRGRPRSWGVLPRAGLIIVAFCSGIWVAVAALCPRWSCHGMLSG
jgi:hypothetical protein